MDGTKVVVTTKHRGVFFGTQVGPVTDDKSITLEDARNCVRWVSALRGFMGLAAVGPNSDCRIGPAVKSITLYDITAVLECTDEAVAAWEVGPWR